MGDINVTNTATNNSPKEENKIPWKIIIVGVVIVAGFITDNLTGSQVLEFIKGLLE